MQPLQNLYKYNIVLASASPRRRELLGMLGIDFTVAQPIDVDESYPEDMPAEQVPLFLSQVKSDAYRALMRPNDLIITADTVVILDGKVLGKPHDVNEAVQMLSTLQGRVHTVVSGVTVTTAGGSRSFSVSTDVEFAPLTADEIAYYVKHYRPLDKAGAYGIQEWIGAAGVKGMNGSFYNVMGLPVNRLYSLLKTL